MFRKILNTLIHWLNSFLSAIVFYTTIPLPSHWPLSFERIARWAPIVGLGLGAVLGLIDQILNYLGFPIPVRSGLIVAFWLKLTGGLHLDGVVDTADGLAVTDPTRRLAVMQDSVTGAFGVMAAIVVLGLKTLALSQISRDRGLILMIAAGWGRWGQVGAIAFYPYLKPTGKGAFHKQQIKLPEDLLWGLITLLMITGVWIGFHQQKWLLGAESVIMGSITALGLGFWFYRRLGGQTGDTYGAVVEWTEALILCSLTRDVTP
jgi:adenosylcobinamide-GDP ribazoletransferase